MRRVLILGGTAWLGNTIAREAVRAGADVVCLARGVSGTAPEGARFVRADRTVPGAYGQVDGDWDKVIELAYDPDIVGSALDALAGRARHWTLVSTVSVYQRNDEPGADESAALVKPQELTEYADAKVAAELASRERLGERLLVMRPGLIVGAGDASDRFGYWLARLRRGGQVLMPKSVGRFVQVIDVLDLAAFIVSAGRDRLSGTVNAVGHAHAFEEFFAWAAEITDFEGEAVHVSDELLRENDVRYWAGPRSLPLWLPASDAAFSLRSNAAFLAAGGLIRPLRDSMTQILQDEQMRGLDRDRRSGLTVSEEREILERIR
nr:reductase [Cryobacterium sp. CG_9.6]